jgi:ribonuclease HI
VTQAVELYTDGACSGNPGPGGWGAVLIWGRHRKELSGGADNTTNNRMELTAVIRGIEALRKSCRVNIHTDSVYVMKGMTEWIGDWKQRGWKTSGKKPVKNEDLWRRLDEVLTEHKVKWRWVKGHSGVPDNERADELARLAIPGGRGER